MDRFTLDSIVANHSRTCKVCKTFKLYFLKNLNICVGCGTKVPRYIPVEQAVKFLLTLKGK